jgi:phage FluMu gp28-like protein
MSRGGSVTYNSTPFGDMNIYHEMWKENNTYDLNRILLNWRDCPDLTDDKINQIRNEIGEDAYLQEYENKFLSDMEGQEFPMQLIESIIDYNLELKDDPALTFRKDKRYVGGVDIGRKHDLTAITAFKKEDGKFILEFKKTLKDVDYAAQRSLLSYIINSASFDNFTIDESGIGNQLAEELRKEYGIRTVTFTNQNKQEMVTNIKNMMQDGLIKIPNDSQTINSIRAIKRIYTPNNYIKFDSDRDSEIGHSDVFWSMALALYNSNRRKGTFRLG